MRFGSSLRKSIYKCNFKYFCKQCYNCIKQLIKYDPFILLKHISQHGITKVILMYILFSS